MRKTDVTCDGCGDTVDASDAADWFKLQRKTERKNLKADFCGWRCLAAWGQQSTSIAATPLFGAGAAAAAGVGSE